MTTSAAIKVDSLVFTDLNKFNQEVKKRELDVDVGTLLTFTGNYVKELPEGLIMKIVDYDQEPTKIMLFFKKTSLAYSCKPVLREDLETYEDVVAKPHGLTTVVALILLTQAVESFKRKRDKLIEMYKTLEMNFDENMHRDLTRHYQEYYDRLEDLSDLLLKLEERSIPQVETNIASFDYSILLAEVNNLFDRAKMRIGMLKDLAFGYEMKVTRQLNQRVEVLSDVVKRLTAITVILMVPNIIAGHFGMNFRFMPELEIPWAYPAVVITQIVISITILLIFRKKGWF
jgi:Mg2+ and Co2+ transporter CorA